MKFKPNTILILVLLLFAITVPDYALAGPGGYIAKGLFKTWYGKIFLVLISIILLPLIVYIRSREYLGIRKNKKQLTQLGMKNNDFNWLNLQKNVTNIYERVHVAWEKENMEEASKYVSDWYWQNQQLVFLDEWKRNGLKNVCKIWEIKSVKPLYLEISHDDQLEGSKIAFLIDAHMEDYLMERATGKIVQGKKGYADEERIWVMEYTNGEWKLDDIQEGSLSLAFIKTKNVIPEMHLSKA